MIKKIVVFLIVNVIAISFCFSQQNIPREWDSFEKHNLNGTFVLYDLQNLQYKFYNPNRADSTFTPASTFKILHSLIALKSKAVADENEIIKWDGIDRKYKPWNKDQSMKSAIEISCVWFYQELAKRIGFTKMQYQLNKVGYGNEKMGSKIDDFWLVGNLKISAMDQIHFLERLIHNDLPYETKNLEIVKQIMITDSTENYIIHSKTGWGDATKPGIGWMVGYVEKNNQYWIFALNIDINHKSDLKYRKKIVYDILKQEQII